jgi:hypothetical protein
MNASGHADLYFLSSDTHEASLMVEGSTPVIHGGECQEPQVEDIPSFPRFWKRPILPEW